MGTVQQETDLKPGEVSLRGGTSQVRLGQSSLELNGHIMVNGMDLERYIREIVGEMLGAMGG